MMESSGSGEAFDRRRRRAHFRAWHRGMREVDLILGGFADREIATLSDDELEIYEALLAESDANLLKWVTGELPVPDRHDTSLFSRIIAYRPPTAD